MTVAPSLTAEQERAVRVNDGAYVLVAPPGSGKTEVLVRRVLRLLSESAGQPFRILALTFTTKAAEGMRERIRAEVGAEEWRVSALTFHAFCLEMLQHHGSSVGVSSEVSIIDDEDDRAELLRRGLADEGFSLPDDLEPSDLRGLLARIDRLRVDLEPTSAAPATPLWATQITLRDAYEAYENVLESCRAIDFNGMLMRAYELLTQDAWVSKHYRKMYRYIVVDEAQDTNLAQYEILRTLCSDGSDSNVFLVADANQSIFAFTGASPTYVDRFMADFSAKRLELTTNFRSAVTIIEAADRLAQHFKTRRIRPSPMVAATSAAGWIGACAFADEASEGRFVAGWIAELLDRGLQQNWLHEGEDPRVGPEDIAVLGRTRFVFHAVLAELEQNSVPFLVRTEEAGFFSSELGRVAFYSLRVLANPRDLPSRRRLGIDDSDPQVALSDALEKALRHRADLPPGLIEIITDAARQDGSVSDLVKALVGLQYSDEDMGAEIWAADREQLDAALHQYELRTRPQDRTISGFLGSISRVQRAALDQPGVRILTPYRAKGLEFRAVAILGMNEGMFPYYRSSDTEQAVDEERRSVYVAVTRAARALLLTRPKFRQTTYGNVRSQEESRFVQELGLSMEDR